MSKLVYLENLSPLIEEIKKQNKTIVVAGGVFDILHNGHLSFLKQAKKSGDVFILLVESDESVKKSKGEKRPLNSQKERISILSALPFVDYILPLPHFTQDAEYDNLITMLKPDIIATTRPDPYISHKKRQAEKIGAEVIEVIERIPNVSTTDLINSLK